MIEIIELSNPNFTSDKFERNEEEVKITGQKILQNGVVANMGIVKDSGIEEPVNFNFNENFEFDEANEWLEKFENNEICQSCVSVFEKGNNKEYIVESEVGELNRQYADGRTIMGLTNKLKKDNIPVRDRHTKEMDKVLGFVDKDSIKVKNNKISLRWKVASEHLKKLIDNAPNPLTLFQYSPEILKTKRFPDPKKILGDIVGLAVTTTPAGTGTKTNSISIGANKLENFEKVTVVGENFNDGGNNMGNEDKYLKSLEEKVENFENSDKAKDKQIEEFESEIKTKDTKISDLEEKVENFETAVSKKDEEISGLKEKVENFETQISDKDKIIEKFEGEARQSKLSKIVETGKKIGLVTKDNLEEFEKSLEDKSEELLDEKLENFELMAKTLPKKTFRQLVNSKNNPNDNTENFEGGQDGQELSNSDLRNGFMDM